MNRIRLSLLTLVLAALPGMAQGLLQLRGQVTDPSKAAIPAATVSLIGADNFNRTAQTDEQGRYILTGLQPGKFVLRVNSVGFAPYEQRVDISGDRPINFDISLKLAVEQQQVTISDTSEIALDPSDPTKNVGSLVLKGDDLQILSDNPDDLANDLQALAGPSVGPNGGQIFIDGFSGGRLPPKESIREVRINSNPFSSEYDRPGFGRIEILTKPGTDKLHGSAFFNFTDDVFNSRNPYSTIRPPYQQRFFGGHLSGALSKKASFFVDYERRNQDETSVINAVTLDPNFNPTTFSTAILNPTIRDDFSTRLDYQLSANHTLAGRYRWFNRESTNEGLSALTLPSRAYNMTDGEHSMQLTETSVLGAKAVSETRFRYEWDRINQNGNSLEPAIQVLDSFTGGGAPFSLAYNNQNSWELGNTTSITHGTHMIKIGGRFRGSTVDDFSTQNYNGTYTFSSLAAYQLQLQGMAQGLTNEQIRAMGGGPMQFTLTGGVPLASVSQYDIGVFFQDDWRLKPNFTLSTGLRYETQTNISSNFNFAPRVSFAWGIGKPGGMMRSPKLVVRGGWGIFYDRFDENLTLNARRQNGIVQQLFTIRDPNFYPAVPSIDQLQPSIEDRTIQQVYAGLSSPYLIQTTIGIERQFPKNITVAVNYANSRGLHQLRARNINAPLPGTYDPNDPASGVYPYGRDAGNVYLYEASGSYRQNQLMTNLRAPINSKLMLFGFYVLNYANSDTDGAGATGGGPPGGGGPGGGGGGGGAPNLTFPANTYDLSAEWGRARFDIRHRFVLGGNIVTWRGITLNPFVIASSGAPFNITLGRDLNGDNQFMERPAFAAPGAAGDNIKETPWGIFNTTPGPNDVIIPRNYGDGPGQFLLNLRVSKTWGWGERTGAAAGPDGAMGRMPSGPPPGAGGPGGGGGRGGGGMPGGGRMGGPGGGGPFGGGSSGRKYSLTFSASARNLLNHVNPGQPIGTLTSTLFGESNQLASGFFATSTANRRIDLQLRFTF